MQTTDIYMMAYITYTGRGIWFRWLCVWVL